MKIKISIILFFSILSFIAFAEENIFEKINNKTWFESNGFAGTTIVFYKTSNGLIKAIRQLNGSGVPVVSSGIYDVVIRKDSIFLFNGLNLKTSENLDNQYYTFQSNTELLLYNGEPLNVIYDKPILYAWSDNRKNIITQIDVKRLAEIVIEKNEIYKDEDLVNTLIDQ